MANGTCPLEGVEVIDKQFWKGRRVLVTGHTGFKGAWLSLWLNKLEAEVTGIALPPATTPNLFEATQLEKKIHSHFCDIRNAAELAKIVHKARPEIVFHLAAQSLVRESYRDPLYTFAANVMGTAHILNALRGMPSVRVAVVVTTDKVYRNNEWHYPYKEEDPLGGHDPYSASKAACEMVIESYRLSFLASQGVAVASARAGNVIGGGDWAQDRIIPDAVKAWENGQPLVVRNPEAVRPWQHVLEPLFGYIVLAQRLYREPKLSGSYNFGPATDEVVKVKELVEWAKHFYGRGEVIYSEEDNNAPHEAKWLTLETAKAQNVLGIRPKWNVREAICLTMQWYKDFYEGKYALNLCLVDIEAYEVYE